MLGVEVATLEIQRSEEIAAGFEALKGRADALYVVADPLLNTNRTRINTLAAAAQLPTVAGFREYVEAGSSSWSSISKRRRRSASRCR